MGKSQAQDIKETMAVLKSAELIELGADSFCQVRIFTARINPNHHHGHIAQARRAIEAWCQRHPGRILPVTHEKDWDMVMLLDDRARPVEHATGRIFCGQPRKDLTTCRYAITRNRRQMNRR